MILLQKFSLYLLYINWTFGEKIKDDFTAPSSSLQTVQSGHGSDDLGLWVKLISSDTCGMVVN